MLSVEIDLFLLVNANTSFWCNLVKLADGTLLF